ncbi:MAG: deoxyribodipyrimidine photo-lyase [Bacteroidetes bacterium]|nr:deoxyribodipyrimidine photo-lyase [Bacteroidota bacterium]
MASPINPSRIRTINDHPHRDGTVVYWMGRDMRSQDNWALLFAQSLGMKYKLPLAVVFVLMPEFLDATERAYRFILKGLEETERSLQQKGIPFYLLLGRPEEEIPKFVRQHNVSKLVTDFNPLNIVRSYKKTVAARIDAAFYEVDAHNIIPAWTVSDKQEFGAYTIRPKVHRMLPEYLEEYPPLRKHPYPWPSPVPATDWQKADRSLKIDRSVKEAGWIVPGETSARNALQTFLKERFAGYDTDRNDPTLNSQSNLSPFLHFGHLAPQRVALEVLSLSGRPIREIVDKEKNGSAANRGSDAALLEELIVRRELADNFTFYNTDYDSVLGFPNWAKITIAEHRGDAREYLYSREQFEHGATHDPLWNAAQRQMVVTGKMHGYMRMYWAKKILEWTASAEEAMAVAIYLNDRYELDGRDPNGYAGIAWSIGGVHDRAWFERPVFGKIRYMNYNGCKSKFAVDEYIRRMNELK